MSINTPKFERGHAVTFGTTGSGKTLATVLMVVAAAAAGMAVVVLDPHRESLALHSLIHLLAAGYEQRIVFDSIPYLRRTPRYRLLRPSAARNRQQRDSANDQTARNFANLLAWRRQLGSLAVQPQTEDWVMGVGRLATFRDPFDEVSPAELTYAFMPGHPTFTRLVDGCYHDQAVYEFRQLGRKVSRAEVLSAKRLVQNVCTSPAFALRCGTSLDIPPFLSRRGILLLEGGTQGVSEEAVRIVLGSVRHQIERFIYDRRRPFPEVALFIDEAINWGLIDDAMLRMAGETRKMGLHMHLIAQAPSLSGDDLHNLLANCSTHNWHQLTDDVYSRRAAADLSDPELRNSIMRLRPGDRYINRRGRISFEHVPLLEDPWVFPGLSDAKARQALRRIRRRPEYEGIESCSDSQPATTKSSNSLNTTSASNGSSADSSPAAGSVPDDSLPFETVDGSGPLDE